MKTKFIKFILLMLLHAATYAQTNQIGSSGAVGIGTTSPVTYLHIQRGSLSQYTPLLTIEDQQSNGYTQVALKGTNRQFHLGVGNSTETSFGLANKFYIWDQNAVLPRMVVDANGNMGIGSTNPGNRLSIYSGTANTSGLQFLRLNNTATAGTGNGKVLSLDASGNVILVTDGGTSGWAMSGNASTNPTTNYIGTTDNQPLVFKTNGSENMRISESGNISIGTNNAQGYKFAVNGDAIFTKIKVRLYSSWPDYVFDSTYSLPSLQFLEKYVKENKHLPGVAPAAEIEKEGVDLAETQIALLKKIEELTLHLIELNKRLDGQTEEITLLKQSLTELTNAK